MPHIEYIIVTIIALALILPYLLMRMASRALVGKRAPRMDDVVTDQTDMSRPVYLYFMSNTCSNCRAMTPLVSQRQATNPNIIIINISDQRELGMRFGIRGTPSMLSIQDGIIDKVKLGALSEKKLDEFFASDVK